MIVATELDEVQDMSVVEIIPIQVLGATII